MVERVRSSNWPGGRSTAIAAVSRVVTIATVLLALVGAQEKATPTHGAPLPQITTGGQLNWPSHNRDIRGSRYADLDEIDTSTVERLELAWSFEVERRMSSPRSLRWWSTA